jgi:transposase
MRRERRKFSKEYKVEAVRLSEQRGARSAADSLGLDISLIYQWKKLLESEGAEAFRGNGNRTALEEENRQVKLENRNLREEIEILKKAAAYFAKLQR